MAILNFILGMLFGIIIGFFIFVNAQLLIDKKAVNDGVIKLDGSIYKLDKIEL